MATDVSSVVSHFPSAENGFTTTTSGSVSSAATTVGLNSVAGYSNGEVAVFVIDPTDANKKQTFTGIIDTSGVQVTSVVWTAGTNQTHAAGATVVDYATATHISMMTKGIRKSLGQDGHIATTGVATFTDHIDVADTKSIRDGNNNELMTFSETASAVNEITLKNAATGNGPEIQATGGDTNIDIELVPKGTGDLTVSSLPMGATAWKAWTPSYANISVGSGTVIAEYIQIGKTVHMRYSLTFAADTTIGSSPSISLPVTASANASSGNRFIGIGGFKDATSGASQVGGCTTLNTTTVRPVACNTNGVWTDASATSPFTWATNDELEFEATYEAA